MYEPASLSRSASRCAWRCWPACATPAPPTDPLPSWNDGAARQAIVAFVAQR